VLTLAPTTRIISINKTTNFELGRKYIPD